MEIIEFKLFLGLYMYSYQMFNYVSDIDQW